MREAAVSVQVEEGKWSMLRQGVERVVTVSEHSKVKVARCTD